MASAVEEVKRTVRDSYHELSTGGQIVKKVLLLSNILVAIFGLILIIVGGVAAGGQINALTSTTLASGLIVIGFLIMIVAVIGCWGAMKENKILLYIYFALLIFFAIVEFSVGIAAYVKHDDLPMVASNAWTALYNVDTTGIFDIEKNFQCCGWTNVSDRAVPPFGNEVTCAQLYPSVGSCSELTLLQLEINYSSQTDPASRAALANFQVTNQCCGWTNFIEASTSFWNPLNASNPSSTCYAQYGFNVPCYTKLGSQWYSNYNSKTPAGDAYIVAQQNYWAPNSCCGWSTTSDDAVPPYTNDTCILTHPTWTTPCSNAVDVALTNSLQITGGVGIALGVLEIITIILALVLIIKIPNKRAGGRSDFHNDAAMQELQDEE